jgi:glycerophosphoryl diester phosphodiesterase
MLSRGREEKTDRQPLIIGHRGSPRRFPENTLASFRQALAEGCDMIECDVRRTRDGTLVVCHDEFLAGDPVAALTMAEVRSRLGPGGGQTPTLAELLDDLAGSLCLDIELKESGYETDVLREVARRADESRIWFTSFLPGSLRAIKGFHPGATTGLLLGGGGPGPLLPAGRLERLVRDTGVDLLLPHHSLLKWGALRRASRAGCPAVVWTVNRSAQLRRLLRRQDILAVITDRPEVAVNIREEAARRGQRPPSDLSPPPQPRR